MQCSVNTAAVINVPFEHLTSHLRNPLSRTFRAKATAKVTAASRAAAVGAGSAIADMLSATAVMIKSNPFVPIKRVHPYNRPCERAI